MKMIGIGDCNQCPHMNHKGKFGQPGTVPFCELCQEELPFDVINSGLRAGAGFHFAARKVPGIPDWCPLEDRPDIPPWALKIIQEDDK